MAFEDAATLGGLVKKHGLNKETFEKFKQARTKRIKQHLEIAIKSGASAYTPDIEKGKKDSYIKTIGNGLDNWPAIVSFYTDI